MSQYVGRRIVPTHGGVWDTGKNYEDLTIVLFTATGDSYISRRPVPAGTSIQDTAYWMLYSLWSEQVTVAEQHLKETADAIRKEMDANTRMVNQSLSNTTTTIEKRLKETSDSVEKSLQDTTQQVEDRVTEAEHTTNTNRTELNARMDVIEARQEANVHAATDTNADYAAELVDVRVTKGGKTCASAGEAIRSEVQRLEETIASAEGSAVEKSKLACLGSMGNLARAYRKAGPTVTNGAVKEPGEFLVERITSKTHYGQLYTRFVNEQEGRAWQYLYICKVKEIIGSAGHMSCYQYSADHENLNTHVTKNIKVMYRDEMYTVGYGDILENAHEIYLSPVVLAVDAVAECDEYCMLIDVSLFEKEELDELLLVIKQSPEESMLLKHYADWGLVGMPFSVDRAAKASLADRAKMLTGNHAYSYPQYTSITANSMTFSAVGTEEEVWASGEIVRSADWGAQGGIRVNHLAAGKYLLVGRIEETDMEPGKYGTPGIGVVEPGIANWAVYQGYAAGGPDKFPFTMKVIYDYTGEKNFLDFRMQLSGNMFSRFTGTLWVYDVSLLSDEELEYLMAGEVDEHGTAVKNAIYSSYAAKAGSVDTAEHADTAEEARHAAVAEKAEKTDYAVHAGQWKGKKALVIGDSITAAKKWQLKLAELLGMEVYTHAKGGIGIVRMVDGDNGLQGDYDNETDASGVLRPLTADDVTGMDLIIGLPAYNERSTNYGQDGDLYPEKKTIIGEIQYFINRIFEELGNANNLTCRVLIATPHCAGKYPYVDADGYEEFPAGTGMSMEKMSDVIASVARSNNLPVCDLWHDSGINRFTWTVFGASPDSVNTAYTKYELDSSGTVVGSVPLRYVNGNSYYQIRDGKVVLEKYTGSSPYPFNGDQLHCCYKGYARIGECIVGAVVRAFGE